MRIFHVLWVNANRYCDHKNEITRELSVSVALRINYRLRAIDMCGMFFATQHQRTTIVTSAIAEANAACTGMVSELVSAYVSNNHVAPADLPALIVSVHAAVIGLANGTGTPEAVEPKAERPTPAQIRKSVTKDALISFIDGRRYKTLKRHLTVHGLTPDTYRAQFGLPSDYPMVSAAYSEVRSGLAKSLGLGVQNGRGSKGKKAA